jgi:hypothetical protein
LFGREGMSCMWIVDSCTRSSSTKQSPRNKLLMLKKIIMYYLVPSFAPPLAQRSISKVVTHPGSKGSISLAWQDALEPNYFPSYKINLTSLFSVIYCYSLLWRSRSSFSGVQESRRDACCPVTLESVETILVLCRDCSYS